MSELPPYPSSTILVVEVGSGAHGTGLPGHEDHDEIVIYVESPEEVFSVSASSQRTKMYRTKPEGVKSEAGDTDRTVFPLRRFISLAAAGNPSLMMCFWAPVIRSSVLGLELRQNGHWFIGRHIIPRYRGYMQSQALRLLGLKGSHGHGKRAGARPELVAEHGYDTKYAMHAARLGFQGIELLETGGLTLPIAGEPGDWLRSVRRGEVSFQDWWERALVLDAELERYEEASLYAAGPNRSYIEQWSYKAHMNYWNLGS